jgi:hypothetical protein
LSHRSRRPTNEPNSSTGLCTRCTYPSKPVLLCVPRLGLLSRGLTQPFLLFATHHIPTQPGCTKNLFRSQRATCESYCKHRQSCAEKDTYRKIKKFLSQSDWTKGKFCRASFRPHSFLRYLRISKTTRPILRQSFSVLPVPQLQGYESRSYSLSYFRATLRS